MEAGLRERKKQRTREHIAQTARYLFVARGFDAVPVAEIARAAEVSEKTVFNYFQTKEDLVFWRLESFEEELLAAIRDRAPGESALDAFGRFVLRQRGLLADPEPEAAKQLEGITRMIVDSPALQAREREILERYSLSLAALLADETGARRDDIQPRVVANALMGVHRSLIDFSRARVTAGERGPKLRRTVLAQGRRGLRALEQGLGDYARRR